MEKKNFVWPKLGVKFIKKSPMFDYYSDKLARCNDPDQLVAISREITSVSFSADEKIALILACGFRAKQFDKRIQKGVAVDEELSLVCAAEE